MAEDGYTSSTAFESSDNSDRHSHSAAAAATYGRPSFQSLDSVEESSSAGAHLSSTSPQPRSSSESYSRAPSDSHGKTPRGQPWRDSSDRRDTLATIHSGAPSLVEPTFDENILRALCELDVCTVCANGRPR